MKDDFLFITSKKKLHKVSVNTISFIEAMDDYIKIHLKDSKPLVTRMTMKVMLGQLDHQQFVRAHRSFIVPAKNIKAVGATTILLEDREIPLGKKYAAELLKLFRQKH